MEHILVLLYTLALAAGAASLGVVYQLSRDRRREMFRDYLGFLLLVNLCVAFNLAASYIENASAGSLPADEPGLLMVFVDLAGMAIVGGIVHKLIKFMRDAVDGHAAAAGGRTIFAVLVVVAAAVAAAAVAMPAGAVRQRIVAAPRLTNLLLIAAAVASAAHALVAARALDTRRRKTVRWFAGSHLGAFLVILAGFFAPGGLSWHLLAGGFLGLNLIPLALLRRIRADRLVRFEDDGDLGEFAARYGISSRELEIVAQVLCGKTNQEMAETLFISASTVKNHIHNIYQKCGVRNRVELARLIHRVG